MNRASRIAGDSGDLLARIRRIRPIVEAHRAEADALRRMPDPIYDALVAEDLFRAVVPRDLGGSGADPLTLFELVVELSSYDGSTGWTYGIGAGAITMCSILPLEEVREFLSTPDCVICGSGAPPGKAVKVESGYRLTGRWAWASGIHHARLVGGAALIHDEKGPRIGANGKPEVRFFMIPREQVTVLDTWKTSGMRGTGSTEWVLDDHFVPDERSGVTFTGISSHPDPVFRQPVTTFGHMTCAVAIGVAKGAVEGLKRLVATGKGDLGNQSATQYAVAKAEALQESSHLYVQTAFGRIWENVVEGRPQEREDVIRARRAYVHAVEASIEAVTLCADATGGTALFEEWPFGRAVRDVMAVRGHAVLQRRFMEYAGIAAFGLPVPHPLF